MTRHCSWGVCNSDTRTHPHLKFVGFPNPRTKPERAKDWIRLCGRKDFSVKNISASSTICSKHFPIGVVLSVRDNPDLKPFPACPKAEQLYQRKNPKTVIKNDAKEVLNHGKTYQNRKRPHNQPTSVLVPLEVLPGSPKKLDAPPSFSTPLKIFQGESEEVPKKKFRKLMHDIGCQTDVAAKKVLEDLKKENQALKTTITGFRTVAFAVEESEESTKFYTGLSSDHLQILWETLGKDEDKGDLEVYDGEKKRKKKRKTPLLTKNLKIPLKDQFYLCLMKIRRGYTYKEMHLRFQIGCDLVSRIVKTWLNFLYWTFKEMENLMFVQAEKVSRPLPKHFRNSLLRNVRVCIDCTEMFCESSSNYRQQGNQFSTYKHHTTVKVLIGVAPSGACVFVSDAFEGSISDKAITEKSGFLNFVQNGDEVLADRGFTIHQMLAEKGAKLIIPPFLSNRSSMTLKEERDTKIIAKARIHVERYNQRLKEFKLLSNTIAQRDFPILNQAIFVSCCLTNFTKPLAK